MFTVKIAHLHPGTPDQIVIPAGAAHRAGIRQTRNSCLLDPGLRRDDGK